MNFSSLLHGRHSRRTIHALLASAVALGATSGASAMPIDKKMKYVGRPTFQSVDSVGVELFSGLYVHKDDELSVGAGDSALGLTRYYARLPALNNDSNLETYPFNGDWTHNLDFRAISMYDVSDDQSTGTVNGDVVIQVMFNTKILSFRQTADDRLNNPTHWEPEVAGTSLVVNTSGSTITMTMTAADGTVAELDNMGHGCDSYSGIAFYCGYGTSITSPNGEKLDFEWQTVTSSTERRLKSVRSNRGSAIVFDYSAGTDLQPTKACAVNMAEYYLAALANCPSGAQSVTYTGLTQSAKPGSVTSIYVAPSSAGGTSSFERQNISGKEEVTYDSQNRVTSIKYGVVGGVATGGTRSYAYAAAGYDSNSQPFGNYQTTVTEADGGVTVYLYESQLVNGQHLNVKPWVKTKTDPLNKTTDYTYNGKGQVLTETRHEGDQTVYTYDGNGNRLTEVRKAKPGSGLADITVSTSTYPTSCTNMKICNKPLSVTDARGNTTDFTYDTNHGGVLTETGPAVNSVRPQKRYTYEQRYAAVKNSSGTLVNAATPVWVLKQISECMVGAASGSGCVNSADEVKTVYEFGTSGSADSLTPIGTVVDSGGLSLRTCGKFDLQGNRIATTEPKAGLTTCS